MRFRKITCHHAALLMARYFAESSLGKEIYRIYRPSKNAEYFGKWYVINEFLSHCEYILLEGNQNEINWMKEADLILMKLPKVTIERYPYCDKRLRIMIDQAKL